MVHGLKCLDFPGYYFYLMKLNYHYFSSIHFNQIRKSKKLFREEYLTKTPSIFLHPLLESGIFSLRLESRFSANEVTIAFGHCFWCYRSANLNASSSAGADETPRPFPFRPSEPSEMLRVAAEEQFFPYHSLILSRCIPTSAWRRSGKL